MLKIGILLQPVGFLPFKYKIYPVFWSPLYFYFPAPCSSDPGSKNPTASRKRVHSPGPLVPPTTTIQSPVKRPCLPITLAKRPATPLPYVSAASSPPPKAAALNSQVSHNNSNMSSSSCSSPQKGSPSVTSHQVVTSSQLKHVPSHQAVPATLTSIPLTQANVSPKTPKVQIYSHFLLRLLLLKTQAGSFSPQYKLRSRQSNYGNI